MPEVAPVVMVCADEATVEAVLTGGGLRCPECRGRLGPWGHARERVIRGVARVRPRRAKCRECAKTHVLLPELCLPAAILPLHNSPKDGGLTSGGSSWAPMQRSL